MTSPTLPSAFDQQYSDWVNELKQRIQQSRLKATLSVNRIDFIVLANRSRYH